MLNVNIENVNDVVTLKCDGRIVLGDETQLLCAALPHFGRDILVDLAGVSTIDAAGVGALLTLQAAGIYFKLVNANEHVREVLKLTHLDSIIDLGTPDVSELRSNHVTLLPCSAVGD